MLCRQVYDQAFKKYRQQELADHNRLQRYHESHQSNWVDISKIIPLMEMKQRKYLNAINRFSRIDVAKHVFHVFEDQLQLRAQGLYFVTIVPERFLYPLKKASEFKPRAFKQMIRRFMHGTSYFGMIEPSFYPYAIHPSDFRKGVVHWHAHMLVWNSNKQVLDAIKTEVCKKHKSFILEEPAFHFKSAKNTTTPTMLGYVIKSPRNQYGYHVPDVPASQLLSLGRKYTQSKSEIRTGNLAKLSLYMQDMYLDRLMFAGGDGTAMLKQVKRRSLSDFRMAKH